MTYNVFVGR